MRRGAVTAPTPIVASADGAMTLVLAAKAIPGPVVRATRVRAVARTGRIVVPARSAISPTATDVATTRDRPAVMIGGRTAATIRGRVAKATPVRTAAQILGRAGETTADASSATVTGRRPIGLVAKVDVATVPTVRPATVTAPTLGAATLAEAGATAATAEVTTHPAVVAAKADSARQVDATASTPGATPAPTSPICPRTSRPRSWIRPSAAICSASTS